MSACGGGEPGTPSAPPISVTTPVAPTPVTPVQPANPGASSPGGSTSSGTGSGSGSGSGSTSASGTVATPSTPLGTPDWTRTETPAPWDYQARYPSRSACAANEGLIFEVGPTRAYANPRDVPWLRLMPCDRVRIDYRAQPYTDIIFLGARGAAGKYITIEGVPGPHGERPVFDGRDAVMPATTGANQYLDAAGMIIIAKPGVNGRSYQYKPGYLHITGLNIRNVRAPARVTDLSGTQRAWGDFVAGIYISPAEHVAITNCELGDNSLGLFVNSQDNEASQTRDLLVRNNWFHGNGMVNLASMHNAYTEAIGTIYEYNYFDSPVTGTGGDNIKDRSAGIVFRYNYVVDGVNLISLRDPQSNADFEAAALDSANERLASNAFIYGNVLAARHKTVYNDAPVIVAHGDGAFGDGKQVRDGALYFYSNRVVATLDTAPYQLASVPLFDLINTRSPATVVAVNNLFYATNQTPTGQAAPFALFYWQGLADWRSNWINSFLPVRSSAADGGLSAGPRFDGSGLGGLSAQAGDPAFVNAAAGNYLTQASSPFAALNGALPAAVAARHLAPQAQPIVSPFTAPALP